MFVHFFRQRSIVSKSRGAVLPEFAFVMPLMLFFFGGLLELGRLISQVTWVTQTSYQTSIFGAENPNSTSSADFDAFGSALMGSQQRWLSPNGFHVTSAYEPANNFVRVTVDAKFSSFMQKILPVPLDISVTMVTPHFITGSGDIGNVDRFPMCSGAAGDPNCADF